MIGGYRSGSELIGVIGGYRRVSEGIGVIGGYRSGSERSVGIGEDRSGSELIGEMSHCYTLGGSFAPNSVSL